MKEAVIVSAVRTAIGKASKGMLAHTRPDDFCAITIRTAIERANGLDSKDIDDVIMGCAMPEAEQGLNVARIASLRAGIPNSVGAVTVNRFCSSGLQAIAFGAERILSGGAEVILAGGVESMSLIPMGGYKVSPNPWLVDNYPDVYLSMGLVGERLAKNYDISRTMQDEFSARSHKLAIEAIQAGKFKQEIVPLSVQIQEFDGSTKIKIREVQFDTDEGPRADTSIEVLGKLRPSFSMTGTVTAGNSSQMSDGAAATIIMSADRAKAMGLKPLARFVSFATAGVAPEDMGIGPIVAIPKALKLAGLSINDIKVIELNEAFASQSLAVIKSLELDPEKINVNGGAIALGHPLGCTGARLTASVIYELQRRGGGYGMVSMCVGGGMGAAGIFEVYS